jgi:hypothetical protein
MLTVRQKLIIGATGVVFAAQAVAITNLVTTGCRCATAADALFEIAKNHAEHLTEDELATMRNIAGLK